MAVESFAFVPPSGSTSELERLVQSSRLLYALLLWIAFLATGATFGGVGAWVWLPLAFLLVSVAGLAVAHGSVLGWAFHVADLVFLVAFLVVFPSLVGFLFLFAFLSMVAGLRWGFPRGLPFAPIMAVTGTALLAMPSGLSSVATQSPRWWLMGACAAGVGCGLTYLGGEQRRRDEQRSVVSEVTDMIRVEQGFGESLRQVLGVIGRIFDVERCLLAFYDLDADRLYLWNFHEDSPERIRLEQRLSDQRPWFFLDRLETNFYWNRLGQNPAEGAGWTEGKKVELSQVPAPTEEFVEHFGVRSALAVSFTFGSVPAGRLLLVNRHGEFTAEHLRLLDLILRKVGPTLENLFLLRHLRARTAENERARIARDLHDGVLQTLVSVEMQLDVYKRLAARNPEKLRRDLSHLQELVHKETLDLRQFVSDLKPIHVESEDFMDLVRDMAERYARETGIAVDVLGEPFARELPVRVCRELFQIVREGLNNIKKHSGASHVVVKLREEENRISLMVDDNGRGFSFAGRLSSEELDQLRLGPISIKERTRTIGGRLMIESTPGHGARLTVDVPVN